MTNLKALADELRQTCSAIWHGLGSHPEVAAKWAALYTAICAQEAAVQPEPVAWIRRDDLRRLHWRHADGLGACMVHNENRLDFDTPLYDVAAQAQSAGSPWQAPCVPSPAAATPTQVPAWDIWSDIFLRLNAMETMQGGRTGPSIQLRDLLTQIRESPISAQPMWIKLSDYEAAHTRAERLEAVLLELVAADEQLAAAKHKTASPYWDYVPGANAEDMK